MRASSVVRALVVGGTVMFLLISAANCQAKTYITCGGLCENVLPCNDSYEECIAFCMEQEKKCEGVGHPAAFLAYVACTTDAGFTCNEAGVPIANAPCGPEQAELVQCESADATLDVPDGAYTKGSTCPDAGSCLACCVGAYPSGATEYAAAVGACVCGDGQGNCQAACATEVCAATPVMPTSGDKCDECLTTMLDEQGTDAGPCVIPVTKVCNTPANLECALYVNCVTQPGCTN